jgi:fatty acid desaturase
MAENAGEIEIKWYRSRIEKGVLSELTKRSDMKGFLQVLPIIVILVITGAASLIALHHLPIYALVLILFVHGTVFAFLLNGFHELTHGTLFKTKWLNAFFLRLFSFLGWSSHVEYKASHVRHHLYTLHPPQDLEVVLPVHLTVGGFLLTFLVDVAGFCKVIPDYLRLAFGNIHAEWPQRLFPKEDVRQRRRLFNWARFTLIGHLLIVAVSVLTGQWLVAVLVSGARFYGQWIFFLCNSTQHIGLQDNVPDFRLCTRTIRLNPVLRYFYFQMSWHTEHHMYAAVPCYHLARLRKEIDADMPPSKGLVGAWKEIISILRRQKVDPGYQHVFELPRR